MTNYYSALAHYVKTGESEAMRSFVSDDASIRKLAIFRNTFLSSCADTLERKYPTCVRVLGEEYFRVIARAYVESYTPDSKVLASYGKSMPEFIGTYLKARLDDANLDYVSDLAELDSLWDQVYFAKAEPEVSEETLEQWMSQIDSISLSLNHNVMITSIRWSVLNLWAELRHEALSEKHEIAPEKIHVLMWRDADGQILHRSLSHAEWTFISALSAGTKVTQAALAASQVGQIDISEVFSQLIENNLLMESVT